MRTVRWALPALVVVVLARAAPADELADLQKLWEAGRYSEVLPKLSDYREKAFGRDPQVDYMIGCACCRIDGKEELGRKFFRWTLQHYSLDDSQRQVVTAALDGCGSTATPTRLASNTTRAGGGVVGVRGKTFYYAGAGNGLLTSDPARVIRDVPRAELAARLVPLTASDAADRVKGQLGAGATTVQSGRFILTSTAGHSAKDLTGLGEGLQAYADAFVATYGMTPPDQFITVYLVRDEAALQAAAKKLHGLHVSRMSLGYSFRDDLSIVAVVPREVSAGGPSAPHGTVAHELFHLMVRRNFGDVPAWMDEGMAALVEVSRLSGSRVQGRPNWRGAVLQKLWQERPSAEALVRMSWRSFDDVQGQGENPEPRVQAANHAMARYLMLFLQSRDRLQEMYGRFRARKVEEAGADPGAASVALFERVLGMPIAQIDAAFVEWFKTVSPGHQPG